MNVYVWERLNGELTSSWHSEAGAVVVAGTVERARELVEAAAYGDVDWTALGDWDREARKFLIVEEVASPDHVWPTSATDETVVLFPDAGCC